jgi:hypothetical protein
VAEFKTKYDLSMYTVRLSDKDKARFYLDPKLENQHLALKKAEFKAKSVEDRDMWFAAITTSMKLNELESLSFISQR